MQRVAEDVRDTASETENHPRTEEQSSEYVYCSICGKQLPNPEFALNYPNVVCDACDANAVNENGEKPWHGWPPGEEPESESGTIQMAPDQGENPVYIDDIKCWRRYRFGGWVTLRDTFDAQNVMEFFDMHKRDDGYFQVFNSANPPGRCLDTDRLLVQKVDTDEYTSRVWGMLSAETGDIIARNPIAEEIFGPFEEFLETLREHTGDEGYFEEALTDPTRMLSLFSSFGSTAGKAKVLYLVPELDRPLTAQDGIIKSGVINALREASVIDGLFEVSMRSVGECPHLYRSSESQTATQQTWKERLEQAAESDESTLTVRYKLPYQGGSDGLRKHGDRIAQRILYDIVSATDGTDYRYLASLPAVDIHAYQANQEVHTVAIDAETMQETDWDKFNDQSRNLSKIATTYNIRAHGD